MSPEMEALIIAIQARIAVFLWGEPGIGKSVTTEAVFEAMQEKLWTLILSIREPSDQGGIPILRGDAMWMAPPRWAKELSEEGHGGVFMDEMNTSAPTNQNSALRIVNEGWAGDQKLPKETSFVAAGNPPETNPGVYDLTPAMANRFLHIKWPLNSESWCDGMISGWPTPVIRRLPRDWKKGIPPQRSNIATFIRSHSDLLHQKPDSPTEQGQAWPSPRMWTTAAVAAAAADAMGHDAKSVVMRTLVAGCVGEAVAQEYFTWLVNLDLIPAERYLNNPYDTPLPRRQDQIMATLNSVAAAALDTARPRKEMVHRYRTAWKVLGRAINGQADISMPACRILAVNMPEECDGSLPKECEWILPMLEEANIDFATAV